MVSLLNNKGKNTSTNEVIKLRNSTNPLEFNLIKNGLLGDCCASPKVFIFSNSNVKRFDLWLSLLPNRVSSKGVIREDTQSYEGLPIHTWNYYSPDCESVYERWYNPNLIVPDNFELDQYSLLSWLIGKGTSDKDSVYLCTKRPLNKDYFYFRLYSLLVKLLGPYSGLSWQCKDSYRSRFIKVPPYALIDYFNNKEIDDICKEVFETLMSDILKV